jgi:hypothetical protein
VSDRKEPVRLTLTDEQKAQIRSVTGKNAETLEFAVEDLEERIAPLTKPWKPGN